MLSYLWIGSNDVDASVAFYDSILLPLGCEKDYSENVCSYSLPGTVDRLNGPGTVHVGKPFDGGPVTAGNGMMLAFRTESRAEVDAIYVAALGQGGVDAGAPGTRAAYTPNFYVAYLRDPIGNKIAVFLNKRQTWLSKHLCSQSDFASGGSRADFPRVTRKVLPPA